ncbi:unnamed protein product [Arabis nemorensis]|uniref:Uncharacterized protein n=1 Tax=Arabis nemorensis TaxID=586526 RepID=A0A565APK7_9BRAS|nr:unnamed protein product [Arabis nemorensis]
MNLRGPGPSQRFVRSHQTHLPPGATGPTSENGSTVTEPSNEQLTAAYIEVTTNTKGQVYGLGSIQYLNADPNESAAASLRRNFDVHMCMTGMKSIIGNVKEDVTLVKEDVTGLKRAMEALLRDQ